jgi:hypothetical protein
MDSSLLLARSAGNNVVDRLLIQLDATRGEVIEGLRTVRSLDDACTALEQIIPALISADAVQEESGLTAEALHLINAARAAAVDVVGTIYEACDATTKDSDRRLKLVEGISIAQDAYLRHQAREIMKAAAAPAASSSGALSSSQSVPAVLLTKRNRQAFLKNEASLNATTSVKASRARDKLDFWGRGAIDALESQPSGRAAKRAKKGEAAAAVAAAEETGDEALFASSSSSSSAAGGAESSGAHLATTASLPLGVHPHPYPSYLPRPSVVQAQAWKDNAEASHRRLKETLNEPTKRTTLATKATRGGLAAAAALGDDDPNEPTYCSCKQVAFGHMVGCDNPSCPIEWFHASCVGLTATTVPSTWYCHSCSRKMERARQGSGEAAGISSSSSSSASAAPRQTPDSSKKKRK